MVQWICTSIEKVEPQMEINDLIDHYLGLNFISELFNITKILNDLTSKHKKTAKWQTIEKQVERFLLNKTSFRDICESFNKFVCCIKEFHHLENLITILCLADKFYDFAKDNCFQSVSQSINEELREILIYHLKRRFEVLSNILILLEFDNERAL